jgi:hypothetical protein
MSILRALTVVQPWAWAIIHGPANGPKKLIENRSWATPYRGPLLIHAGKSLTRLGDYGPGEPEPKSLVFGAIIGVVELVDCVPLERVEGQPFAEGPWCWLLDKPRAITPFPCSGLMGLWNPPAGFDHMAIT